jgi:rhodanese-related sulfurtransferase
MDKRPVHTALALLLALSGGVASAQVVGDEACPKYAVDVASYATCDGDNVARPSGFDLQAALLAEERVSPSDRTSLGLYVDALSAHRLKSHPVHKVVLVDVRSQLEVVLAGRATAVDLHVPFIEHTLYRTASGRGWTMAENGGFIDELVQQLQRHNADIDTIILVMCRSGERSARVVNALAEAGYLLAVNVIDGFEGDLGSDGKRSVNGWKNAALPWTEDAQAIASYVDVSLSD